MKDIKQIVANNIYNLRKKLNLTQVEFANKINYSDKAVSRWEKSEVTPDIETLQKISETYNVELEYFFREENLEKEQKPNFMQKYNQIISAILFTCVIWTIATILFVYIKMIYDYVLWQSFVWAVPLSLFVFVYYTKKWKNKISNIILTSLAMWSIIASFYLQFISQNMWLIFIIGLPIQALIVFTLLLRYSK